MATSTYNELISLAEQIRTATAADSNTAELLGGTLKQLIQFVGTLSSDAAIAEGLAEIEAALEEAQSSVSSMETDIQTAVSEAQASVAAAIADIETAKEQAIEEIREFGGVEVVDDMTTGGSTKALSAEQGKKLNDSVGFLPGIIGGNTEDLTFLGNYYVNLFSGALISQGAGAAYVIKLHQGDYVQSFGHHTNSAFIIGYTTTDIIGKTADEINALAPSWVKIHNDYSSSDTADKQGAVKSWVASRECCCLVIQRSDSIAPPFVIRSCMSGLSFDEIKAQIYGRPLYTVSTDTSINLKNDSNYIYTKLYARVSLGSATSVLIEVNANQTTWVAHSLYTADGLYLLNRGFSKPTGYISGVRITWNGELNQNSYVEIYTDNYQQKSREVGDWYQNLYNIFTGGLSLDRSLSNFYTILKHVYDSKKTYDNTSATLKRISKSAYVYAHVPMFVIKDDTVYMVHMQNTSSSGESTSSDGYELVLQYFTLSRYSASDFNKETDVTSVVLGKKGTAYTDSEGNTLTTYFTPGDHSIYLSGTTLHIVHSIRLDSSSSMKETVIHRTFDTSTKTLSESVDVCNLTYNGQTDVLGTSYFCNILEKENLNYDFLQSFQVSSSFVVYNNTYYNTIACACNSVGCCGAIIKTTDFINYTIVDVPRYNQYGADEIMLGIDKNNTFIAAMRQHYGVASMILSKYSNTGEYKGHTVIPAGNSRPCLWYYNNNCYLMYPTAETNRDSWQIVRTPDNPYGLGEICRFQHIATIPANWDYPFVYVYNNKFYFAASLNTRREIHFGELKINNVNQATVMNKFVQLIDG